METITNTYWTVAPNDKKDENVAHNTRLNNIVERALRGEGVIEATVTLLTYLFFPGNKHFLLEWMELTQLIDQACFLVGEKS